MSAKDKRPIVLLGYPLEHSLSPLIHNTAFESQHLDLEYHLYPVHPANLGKALRSLVSQGLVGANVTVPHKESVVHLLDETSDVVQTIGAANTISCRPAGDRVKLVGDNSDVDGFVAPIWQMLPELTDRQVLIFGSGGAARAVGFAVTKYARPKRVVIAARTSETGMRLANLLLGQHPRCTVDFVRLDRAGPEIRRSTLLINTTPLGMKSNAEASIWTEERDFHSEQIVYDLVYWPLETRLVRMARQRGARTQGGLEMLISQAALSYAIWTGRKMPIDLVRERLHKHFETAR
ncbi:MAG: shikimate dehydrogenase [Rhodothermales bacterium]